MAGRVAARLQDCIEAENHVVVGLSGGVDSVVLLDCLRRCSRRLRTRISALHISHQLSPNAGRWASFCRRLCRAQGIPFRAVKVNVRRSGGVEAAARAARYAVFDRQDCDYLALAHHRDDQVETFLLQLLRGAGVKGLAAMPYVRSRAAGSWILEGSQSAGRGSRNPGSRIPHPAILRPLLDVTRAEILGYAKARKLKWIEDESNAEVRFARNYLRHEVLPAIARRFPAYRATIARSVAHIADAARLLDDTAASDAEGRVRNGALAIAALRRLPDARARNLLRAFLAGQGLSMPGADRLGEALRQVLSAKGDAQVQIELDGATLRRHDGYLHVVRGAALPRGYVRRWQGEKRLALHDIGGVLTVRHATGTGISAGRLGPAAVTIRLRRGGERLRPDCRRPSRSLKNLLQERRLPPWERDRLPLVFQGETLIWVPGIGVDCSFQARGREPGLLLDWLPENASAQKDSI